MFDLNEKVSYLRGLKEGMGLKKIQTKESFFTISSMFLTIWLKP
jgi:hypothetical protein